jgi:hypothetical protein
MKSRENLETGRAHQRKRPVDRERLPVIPEDLEPNLEVPGGLVELRGRYPEVDGGILDGSVV